MFRITAITKFHPTENLEKIEIALKTIINGEIKSKKIGTENYLFIESNEISSLDNLYTLFRKQKILDVARKTLRNGIYENSTTFYVNKQVAYVQKINFCEEEGESPLGPIRVQIEYDNIDYLIDWLTPYTRNGKEVKLVDKFP